MMYKMRAYWTQGIVDEVIEEEIAKKAIKLGRCQI